MGRDWWQLLGPARFVEAAVRGLREGKNLAVCLPEYAPRGLREAVAEAWGSDEWPIVQFEASPCVGESPGQQLFARFAPSHPPDALRNAVTLARQPGFAGRVVWVDGVTLEAWPGWKKFLTEYGYACNGLTVFERTLICVRLAGEMGTDPPLEDVCLTALRWSGFVTGLDILVHTHQAFDGRDMPDLLKLVAISVTAKLSMWDAATSERLAGEHIERILNPMPVLREIATERGWCGEVQGWHTGTSDVFEGCERVHSAALAAACRGGSDGPWREIYRRVWSAEVGVVLPFVEEARQEIIDHVGHALQLPFTTRFNEVITDLRDLELGHIESQMGQRPSAFPPDIKQAVPNLRKVRNCLAHHDTLTVDMLVGIGGLA